jgi:hypothetical protein
MEAVHDPGFRGLNPKVQVGNSGVEYPKHHGPESLGWHAAQDIPVPPPSPLSMVFSLSWLATSDVVGA